MDNGKFSLEKVWTPALLKNGWTGLSKDFIHEARNGLGLSYGEAWLVVVLISYKWDDRLPFPSEKRLAEHMGTDQRQVRKLLAGLKRKGLLHVLRRDGQSNLYDMATLFKRLEGLEPRKQGGRGLVQKDRGTPAQKDRGGLEQKDRGSGTKGPPKDTQEGYTYEEDEHQLYPSLVG